MTTVNWGDEGSGKGMALGQRQGQCLGPTDSGPQLSLPLPLICCSVLGQSSLPVLVAPWWRLRPGERLSRGKDSELGGLHLPGGWGVSLNELHPSLPLSVLPVLESTSALSEQARGPRRECLWTHVYGGGG